MIFEPDHLHQQSQLASQRKRTKPNEFNADHEIRAMFAQSLAKSEGRLNQLTTSNLQKLRELRQKRVYTSFSSSSPLEYLFVVFEDRRAKIGLQSEKLESIIEKKQRSVTKELMKEKLSIEKRPKSIIQIKKQLEDSISVLRSSNPPGSISSSQLRGKEDLIYKPENYYEFRKQSYWKIPSQKTEQVQSFLKDIRQKHLSHHKKFKEDIKKQYQLRKSAESIRQTRKIQEHHKLKEELHKQFEKKKQQKEKYEEKNKKKIEEVSQFLKKFKEKPPNYILYSDRYRKKESQYEQEKKEFLKQLKQAKRHSSLSQIKQQLKKYDELKEAHEAQRSSQRKMQMELQEQIKQKLGSLYRSKIYTKNLKQQPPPLDVKAEKKKQMIKMLLYSKQAQMEHGPKIDQEKRFELLKYIEELRKKEDRDKIIKVKNGEEIVINKKELDPRKIGLQYLEEIKQITSQVERQPPPSPPIKQHKLIDKSLQKDKAFNKKITISNWKDIVDNNNLTHQQKQEKMEVFFEMIEEQRLNNMNEQRHSDKERSYRLQKIIDHYQIQKTAAKLAMLKSMK